MVNTRCFQCRAAKVRYLVGELRFSPMPCGVAKRLKKEKEEEEGKKGMIGTMRKQGL